MITGIPNHSVADLDQSPYLVQIKLNSKTLQGNKKAFMLKICSPHSVRYRFKSGSGSESKRLGAAHCKNAIYVVNKISEKICTSSKKFKV